MSMVSAQPNFQALFEAVPIAYVVVSQDNVVVGVSDAYLTATHKQREDLIGKDLFDSFPEGPAGVEAGSTKAVRGTFEVVRQTREIDVVPELRYDLQNADGTFAARYWRMTTKPLIGEDGEIKQLIHVVENVTENVLLRLREEAERKRANEAEIEGERRVSRVLESVSDSFIAMDADFRITYINAAGLRTANMTIDEVLGRIHWDVWPGSVGTQVEATYRRVLKDGVPARILHNYFEEGKYDMWLDISAYPLDGGLVAYYREVTEQVRAKEDLERLVRERTRELEESIKESEAFNYSVAHDLRAPLRAIISTSRLLLEGHDNEFGTDSLRLLERQAHNARRLGTIIDDLLQLSRLARVAVKPRALDITALAKEVAAEVESPCEVHVQEGMSGNGDNGLVRMVLTNLIENACKFSPDGTPVYVGQTGNEYWVKDEGIGFDMQFAPKVFLPFERLVTEDEFEGTGIGLANVERIVRRHGGGVRAESEPGKGATFFFTLG